MERDRTSRSRFVILKLEKGGVAKAKGEGEKEKECTTECKSRRRVGDGMRKGRRNCNKGRNKWKSDGSGPEVMFPVEEGTDQCSVYGGDLQSSESSLSQKVVPFMEQGYSTKPRREWCKGWDVF